MVFRASLAARTRAPRRIGFELLESRIQLAASSVLQVGDGSLGDVDASTWDEVATDAPTDDGNDASTDGSGDDLQILTFGGTTDAEADNEIAEAYFPALLFAWVQFVDQDLNLLPAGSGASLPAMPIVDGSMIYGANGNADGLRTSEGGHLQADDMEPTKLERLFRQEHNRQADLLAQANPNWSDEQLYQGARRVVVAEIQSITYGEFLPALLGDQALPAYAGYDPSLSTALSPEFAEIASRLVTDNLNAVGTPFGQPLVAAPDSAVDQDASDLDDENVDDVADDFLIAEPGWGDFDLDTLDAYHGSQVGLPDYNSVRQAYGLPKVTSFAEITSDPELQARLEQLYGDVDHIDLFVGGLAEDPVDGSNFGPTFQAIFADQFTRLRDGDPNWFENGFAGDELASIQQTTLFGISMANAYAQDWQPNIYYFSTGAVGAFGPEAAPAAASGSGSTQPIASGGSSLAAIVPAAATVDAGGTYHVQGPPPSNFGFTAGLQTAQPGAPTSPGWSALAAGLNETDAPAPTGGETGASGDPTSDADAALNDTLESYGDEGVPASPVGTEISTDTTPPAAVDSPISAVEFVEPVADASASATLEVLEPFVAGEDLLPIAPAEGQAMPSISPVEPLLAEDHDGMSSRVPGIGTVTLLAVVGAAVSRRQRRSEDELSGVTPNCAER